VSYHKNARPDFLKDISLYASLYSCTTKFMPSPKGLIQATLIASMCDYW